MEQALVEANRTSLTSGTVGEGRLLALWLHGRSEHTQRAYRADVERFLAFAGKSLQAVTLGDLQGYSDELETLAPSSRARALSAVKSLLSFGHRLGFLPVDVGRALRLPPVKDKLAERILPEDQVQRMLALEDDPRNHALLRLLYAGGLRVSEVCGLTWRDLQERGDAGQVTIFGKGAKTRVVLLSESTWKELSTLRGDAPADAPVFRSRKHAGHLDPSQVLRIVRAAARRAGIDANVSCHWLRHCHASHALDRGCPISLVSATLGHSSAAVTSQYLHARPNDSSARYLPV